VEFLKIFLSMKNKKYKKISVFTVTNNNILVEFLKKRPMKFWWWWRKKKVPLKS